MIACFRFTSVFEEGRKTRVDNVVTIFKAGKLSLERQCGRSVQVRHLMNRRAPLKLLLQDIALLLWTLDRCHGALAAQAVNLSLYGATLHHSLGKGGAVYMGALDQGPHVHWSLPLRSCLLYNSSANGTELWFGCSAFGGWCLW